MRNYRFSPSALDKFQKLLDVEAEFESDFNFTDKGPKQSLEEIEAQRTQELLDGINKVTYEPTEAAARGTAFNEVIDQLIKFHYSDCPLSDVTDKTGRVVIEEVNAEVIKASCDGFCFTFDHQVAKDVAADLREGTMQMHVESYLQVDDNTRVLLHGFPDYICPTYVADLKTTSSYAFGKYERYWQRYVYPYILQSTGLMQVCESFTFYVVEITTDKKTGVTSYQVWREVYTDANLDSCAEQLRWICGAFADWLDNHKDLITNENYIAHD